MAAGAKAVCCRSETTEGASLRQRRGWGGGGAREKRPCLSDSEKQRPLFSRDLPENQAITIVPPRGRRERAPAREGKDKAALADTALPSSAYRQEGAHFAAECCLFGNFWDAPLGGSTGSAGGNEVAAPTVGR